jgi:hypothetical protein
MYSVRVLQVNGQIAVLGSPPAGQTAHARTDWETAGIPALLTATVSKKTQTNTGTVFALHGGDETVLLSLDSDLPDPAIAFWRVALPGDAASAQAIQRRVACATQPSCFVTPPPQLLWINKSTLLDAAYLMRAHHVAGEEYKGKQYVFFDLGDDTTVYNSLRVGLDALVARVINARVINTIEAVGVLLIGSDGVDGIAVRVGALSHHLTRQFEDPTIIPILVYAPLDAVRKLNAANITPQQLIDASIVLADGNRMKPGLSAAGDE